jgi:hypothetical protein
MRPTSRSPLLALFSGSAFFGLTAVAMAQSCETSSGPRPPAVVELYTSEGCSSCPPADRWLSTLNALDGVLALSFHVNYWNHLGWRDPFATPETTARQYRLKEALGGKYVYTPQVVLNGRDHRNWPGQSPGLLKPLPAEGAPGVRLKREGNLITAQLSASSTHATLAGYWAVLQDGIVSKVSRGENAGEALRHDHVVRLYQPVEPWAGHAPHSTRLSLAGGRSERVAFVVTTPDLMQPLQGLVLQCPT